MAVPGESKTSPRRIRVRERQAQALELRKAGASFDQIAAQLGYHSKQAAHFAVKTGLAAIIREPAEELRALDLRRLDQILLVLWRRVQEGDLAAIDRVFKALERRAALLGLDAPARTQVQAEVASVWRFDLSDPITRDLAASLVERMAIVETARMLPPPALVDAQTIPANVGPSQPVRELVPEEAGA